MDLCAAIKAGDVAEVERLLNAGTDVEGDCNGYTPLIVAALNCKREIVELLLARGANFEATGKANTFTPLIAAVRSSCYDVVELLLARGAIASFNGRSLFEWSAMSCNLPLVQIFYRPDMPIQELNNTLVKMSRMGPRYEDIGTGYKGVFEFLLNKGADIETKGYDVITSNDNNSVLWIAASIGNLPAVNALIALGANIEYEGSFDVFGVQRTAITPLWIASYNGHIAVVDTLIEHGANMQVVSQPFRETLLHKVRENLPMLNLLIEKGADIEAQNHTNQTPLMIAAMMGYPAIVERLLEAGADRSKRDVDGRTAYDLFRMYHGGGLDGRIAKLLQPPEQRSLNLLLADPTGASVLRHPFVPNLLARRAWTRRRQAIGAWAGVQAARVAAEAGEPEAVGGAGAAATRNNGNGKRNNRRRRNTRRGRK